MANNGTNDYFISDVDDEVVEEDYDIIAAPVVVVPEPAVAPAPVSGLLEPSPAPVYQQQAPQPVIQPPAVPAPSAPVVSAVAPQQPAPLPRTPTREERLETSLNALMIRSTDIQAAALVSMDGFVMASALPEGMQEDRVGAMSAAILGLGERAAAELGRGHLTQVFIEGEGGYVILISAGERGVLTALTLADSKVGLVLYDMKAAAAEMAAILG